MKNHELQKPTNNKFLKFFVIPLMLVFMGINCFASPTGTSNSNPIGYYGIGGQLYCSVRNFTNYGTSVNFAIGPQGNGDYISFGNGSITGSFVDNGSSSTYYDITSNYTTNFVSDGFTIYAPLFMSNEGYPTYKVNISGTVYIAYDYFDESSSTWTTYSNTYSVYPNEDFSLINFDTWQPILVDQFILNYRLQFTPHSNGMYTISVRDYYNNNIVNSLQNYLGNTQYQAGWTDGMNWASENIIAKDREEYYNKGKADARAEMSAFSSLGEFIHGTLGSFFDAPLFGDGMFSWLTIGNLIGSIVAIAFAILCMKLFMGG